MSRKIKGLAWDNDPTDYMAGLKLHLHHRGIELETCQYEEDFYAAFNQGGWSFVVIDLLDQSTAGSPPVGLDLSKYVASAIREAWFPIFVVTREMQLVVGDYYKQLPTGAVLSFKIPAPLMALNIQQSLRAARPLRGSSESVCDLPVFGNRSRPCWRSIRRLVTREGRGRRHVEAEHHRF